MATIGTVATNGVSTLYNTWWNLCVYNYFHDCEFL